MTNTIPPSVLVAWLVRAGEEECAEMKSRSELGKIVVATIVIFYLLVMLFVALPEALIMGV